jgi:hypothetical protein
MEGSGRMGQWSHRGVMTPMYPLRQSPDRMAAIVEPCFLFTTDPDQHLTSRFSRLTRNLQVQVRPFQIPHRRTSRILTL